MTRQRRPIDLASMSVSELIQKSLTDFTREDLYIGIPVVITSTKDYETKQTVDVTPLINDEYRDDVIINAPTLRSIFVKIPNGGGFSIKLPIAVGDLATLHYCHRNITTFLDGTGAAVDTPIDMVADIKDCYVTHGFGTRSTNQNPSKTDLIISGPKTTITIKPDGTVETITTGTALLRASDGYTIDNDVLITGDLVVDKTITAPTVSGTSSLLAAGKEIAGHIHAHGTPNTGPNQ